MTAEPIDPAAVMAEQIEARLAEVRASEDPEIWNYAGDALADLEWMVSALASEHAKVARVEARHPRVQHQFTGAYICGLCRTWWPCLDVAALADQPEQAT